MPVLLSVQHGNSIGSKEILHFHDDKLLKLKKYVFILKYQCRYANKQQLFFVVMFIYFQFFVKEELVLVYIII